MKKQYKIAILILGLLSMLGIFLCIIDRFMENKAVTFIGGKDGPTSIYLAGKAGSSNPAYIGTAILIIVTIGLIIYAKRKK